MTSLPQLYFYLVLHAIFVGSSLGWQFPSLQRRRQAGKISSPAESSRTSIRIAPTAFDDWCTSIGIEKQKLEHTCKEGIPGISVRSTSSLASGECAIVLPVEAAIVVLHDDDADNNNVVISPIPDLLCDKAWNQAHQKLKLACILLSEHKKGEASTYKGYIDHLPPISGPGRARCDTLDRWTQAQLTALQSPGLVEIIVKRAEMDVEWFESLQSDSDVSREQFDWALDIVRTRAFAGDYSVPNNGEGNDIALLPVVDDLNHQETSLSYDIDPESSSLSQSPGQTKINFPPVAHVLGRTSTAICWVAHEIHESNSEVAHSYLHGVKSIGEDFLIEWGFIPSILDANIITVQGVPILTRGDGRIENESTALETIRKAIEISEPVAFSTDNRPSDGDVWRCIADACDKEADSLRFDSHDAGGTLLVLPTSEDDDDDSLARRRHAITESFLQGKTKLLRNASKWARHQEQMCQKALS
ncbi:unnamed protein product [Cylindrotheca closterium]|uniref:SET domain-containing protein n=1 Tax=Cylindrotheca closterium TaxID=2856 RepID=A0AAD2FF72_9STRA|nr:unnamed protein product [Cylindrotheca closterium]